MRRRRVIVLTGIAATSGCLRLQDDQAGGGNSTAQRSEGSGEVRDVSGTWAQYGYDAARTGTATGESGPTDDIAKQWHVTDNQPHSLGSSPAVADGNVYIVTNRGEQVVWAIDATTGETQWKQPVGGLWKHSLAIANGQLFCATTSGEAVALDTETGAYNWQVSIDGNVDSQNNVAVNDGTVYITDDSGRFYMLSTDDGTEIERIEFDGRCLSGPAITDGKAFVATFGPTDPDAYPEGAEDWVFTGGDAAKEIQSDLVAMDGSGTIQKTDTQTGDIEWSVDLPDFVTVTPTVADGTIYVGCWDGYLYAIDAADGSQEWRYELGTPVTGDASVADETVYIGDWDATLHAISTAGDEEWILPSDVDDARITTKPTIADGVVYVNINRGIIAADSDGRQLWEFQGRRRWFDESSPAVVDGSLFVCGSVDRRTIDGGEEPIGGLYKVV